MEFFSLSDARPPRHTIATDVWAFGMTIYVITPFIDAEDKLIFYGRSCCLMIYRMPILSTEIKLRSSYQEGFFRNFQSIVRQALD